MKELAARSTVLIVEDDISTNRLIQMIMSQAGFETVRVHKVREAMQVIDQGRFDLVLLDVFLPDGSGFDVCRYLQSKLGAQQTPVIFLSAHDDAATKVRGFDAGGVDYITKPINKAELVARVTTHLRLRHAYDKIAELQAERIQRLTATQESLMPKPEDLPEAKFAVDLAQVAKAGGDFYDVVVCEGGAVDYVVADISGHDLSSSFWTAALKTLITEYAVPANSPRDILHAMNRVLCKVLPEGNYFSVVYARLQRNARRLSVVSAGHPPAFVVNALTREVNVLSGDGDVMGAYADAVFYSIDLEVADGDRLFLYSDGLIEVCPTRQEGLTRLTAACLAGSEKSLPDVVAMVTQHVMDGVRVKDDFVLMGIDL